MGWPWQETYNAFLLEKSPDHLPARLTAAEKAILQRLQELSEGNGDPAEIRALREALDRLCSQSPRGHQPPLELVDEEEPRRHLPRLVSVSLALTMALAIAWIVVKKAQMNQGKPISARDEASAVVSPHMTIMAEPLEPVVETSHPENDSQTIPQSTAPVRRAIANLDGHNNPREQNQVEEPEPDSAVIPAEEPPVAEPSGVPKPSGEKKTPENAAGDPVGDASSNPNTPSDLQNQGTTPAADDSAGDSSPNPNTRPEVQNQSAPPAPPVADVSGSVSVSSSTYPSIRVPPALKAEAARSATSLQIGAPVSRVEPVYPTEAERQGIEGTVRLRALIGTDGRVKDVHVLHGPSLLWAAGVTAIRKWQYQPTLLGDQPIEVDEDITIVFRLAKEVPAAN